MLLSKRRSKVTFQHILKAINARQELATNVFFPQNLISRWLILWYRKNISKPNSWANHYSSIFTTIHWHIIGICISVYSVGHIQTTITLSISIEKTQNLCSNSCSECLISKIFKPPLKVPYRSKVIVETVTKGHFSTHFLCDYGSWITSH